MILSTFNKELYEKNLKQDAYEEGKQEGALNKLKELVQRKLIKGKTAEEIADALEENIYVIQELIEELQRENNE